MSIFTDENMLCVMKRAWKLKVMQKNNETWKDRKVIKYKFQQKQRASFYTTRDKIAEKKKVLEDG